MRAMRGRGGTIVATASAAGIKAEAGVAAVWRIEGGADPPGPGRRQGRRAAGIRVNAIAPAGVETPVWDAVPMFADRAAAIGRDAAFAELAALATPLGRYAKPEEIARQIAFLLSDDAWRDAAIVPEAPYVRLSDGVRPQRSLMPASQHAHGRDASTTARP